jgi:hypothetical protein
MVTHFHALPMCKLFADKAEKIEHASPAQLSR